MKKRSAKKRMKTGVVAQTREYLKERKNRITLLALGLILLYTAIYGIVFVIGPSYFGDDLTYTFFANQMIHGTFVQGTPFSFRLMNIFPIAFFYALFGIGSLTTAAWSMVCFLGIIVVTFLIGRKLYNELAGILAALLAAFFPLFVTLSGTDSPNIVGGFFVGLILLSAIYAVRERSKRWYFCTGVFVVAALLSTPQTAGILVVLILYLAIEFFKKNARIDRISVYLLYGLLAAGALLAVYNYANTQNPIETLTGTVNTYASASAQNYNMDLGYYFSVMFPYKILAGVWNGLSSGQLNPLNLLQTIYIPYNNFVGYYIYAVVACGAYLALKRDRHAYIPLLWTCVGFLCLEFGWVYISLSPFHYVLTGRLERYLTVIGIPIALLISFAVVRFIGSVKRSWPLIGKAALAAVFILLLIGTAVPISQFWYNLVQYQTYGQKQIAAYLSALPNNTKVYLDTAFNNVVVYMGYVNQSRFTAYDGIKDCGYIPANVYVIVPVNMSVSGLNYTLNPESYCPGWQPVMDKQEPGTFPSYIANAAGPFVARLYYVNSNSST